MVKKTKVKKKATKKKAAPKRKAASKKKAAPKKKALITDTYQAWLQQQISLLNKK